MANLEKMTAQYVDEGYSELLAEARVCQDIVLKAISESTMNRNVTIKGGVVMRSITGDVRRATRDIDFDFIKYSIDESAMADINDMTRDTLNIAVLRMIQAYDSSHNPGMLDVAKALCDKIQTDNPLYKINELQIRIRSDKLSTEDYNELDRIIECSDNESIVCAAHILKGEFELARDMLSNMDGDGRKMIEEWPIYSLMKE